MKTLTGKDLINTYIMNDNGKLLKLYMETCASVGLHVFHDGNEAFDAEFYRSGLFIACNEYSDPSSEGVLQLFMTDEDLGYELTWEELAKMNIDNLVTQTPEEKEALDSIAWSRTCELSKSREREFLDLIDTTPHQYESVASKEVEWDGKGLPPVGAMYTLDPNHDVEMLCKYSSKYVVVGEMLPREVYNGVEVVIDTFGCLSREFRKPETPQHREERERLEAAYDLYFEWMLDGKTSTEQIKTLEDFLDDKDDVGDWLRIVDKTNYRKESN